MNTCDICHEPLKHRKSTLNEPYAYGECGLSNVLLINVDVYSCPQCGIEVADIPSPRGLHALLAKDILLQPLPLTGEEFRFLRKETGCKPKDFAELLGVDPKTLANWENSESLNRQNDLSVRFLVAALLRERHKGRLASNFFVIPDNLVADTWEITDQEIADLARTNTYLGITSAGWEFGPVSAE